MMVRGGSGLGVLYQQQRQRQTFSGTGSSSIRHSAGTSRNNRENCILRHRIHARRQYSPKEESSKVVRLQSSLTTADAFGIDLEFFWNSAEPFFIAAVALGLFLAAQGYINSMLKGDQGLGAFLQDGSGFKNSAYSPSSKKQKEVGEDPMPWLSLPKLDFVEVAGQKASEEMVQERLELLRKEMNQKLLEGKTVEATALRRELERLCEECGFEFSIE